MPSKKTCKIVRTYWQRIKAIKTSCALILVVMISMSSSVLSQQSQSEHDGHHTEPPASPQSEPANAQSTGTAVPNNNASGMGGGMAAGMGGEGGMAKMMEQMGAPKPKDLYPSLMRLSVMSDVQKKEVLEKANLRMVAGNSLMVEGFLLLTQAESQQNYTQMEFAATKMEQGLNQFDSGLAAKRAIVEHQEPRRVALTWFKSQMNLLPPQTSSEQTILFGMSPLHTGVMFVLLLFTVTMVWMYGFKMRRAAQLLQSLESNDKGSTLPVAPNADKVTNELSNTPETRRQKDTTIPVINSTASVAGSAKKGQIFNGKMRVIGIFTETHDVKTFRFGGIKGYDIPFDYEPGQFVTFSLDIPGQEKVIKRSYTIASSPTEKAFFEVTIKREELGLVSRYFHDMVSLSDDLLIKAPGGKFYFNGDNETSVVLVSGGVGITPMMSATRYLTDHCWQGNIYFLFCTRSSNDFIFEQELKYLQARHKNLHVLVSMTRAEGTSWMGPQGRLTPELVTNFVPDIPTKTAHICGPPAMMDAMKDMFIALGMAKNKIKMEAFGSAPPKQKITPPLPAHSSEASTSNTASDAASGFTVNFMQSDKQAVAQIDETVLDIADALDIDIDNSCRAGSCGSCKVKLLSGHVEMEIDDALDDEEKSKGFILACQAIPTTPVEVEA